MGLVESVVERLRREMRLEKKLCVLRVKKRIRLIQIFWGQYEHPKRKKSEKLLNKPGVLFSKKIELN